MVYRIGRKRTVKSAFGMFAHFESAPAGPDGGGRVEQVVHRFVVDFDHGQVHLELDAGAALVEDAEELAAKVGHDPCATSNRPGQSSPSLAQHVCGPRGKNPVRLPSFSLENAHATLVDGALACRLPLPRASLFSSIDSSFRAIQTNFATSSLEMKR